MIAGAHCTYPPDYISKCVEMSPWADNIGGMLESERNAINIVRNDKLGVGASTYRSDTDNEPRIVDTVFGGCYRKEVFEKIGLFNENLTRGQDLEFNLRLKKVGMKTLLVPDIVSHYYARSEFWPFLKHTFQDGKWITLALKYSKNPVTLRHLIPLGFVLTIPISIIPYSILALVRSIQLAIRERKWRYAFVMPFIFFGFHFSWGLGSLWGLWRMIK